MHVLIAILGVLFCFWFIRMSDLEGFWAATWAVIWAVIRLLALALILFVVAIVVVGILINLHRG